MNEEESAAFFAYIDTLNAPIADEKELQKIFNAWSSKSGYFNAFFNREKPESFDVPESVKANLGLRNLMTCASHHDLLRNNLLLMERYELSRAQENFHIIEKAQHPEFVKL